MALTPTINPRDPDAALVAVFKHHAIKNEAKSAAAGRPIYDDVEIVEIRFPGSRNMYPFPATSFARWITDPFTGEQVPQTYAERFAHQYQQFKAQTAQTKAGTPIDFAPFLTVGKRAELKALNIYTLEALAVIDGAELKNLGQGGRELKNRAIEFLEDASRAAPNTQLAAELEALRARNLALEEDNKALKQHATADEEDERSGDEMLDAMSDKQLKDYIGSLSGSKPVGSLSRKTLLRMALEVRNQTHSQHIKEMA